MTWLMFLSPMSSVVDPDPEPDPQGSETFGRNRIRSGTDINILDPVSDPDFGSGFESGLESGSEINKKKEALYSGLNKVVSYDNTYFTWLGFFSSSPN